MTRAFKDKMMSRAVPGYALTQPYNPWGNPPKHVEVEDALQDIINGLEDPNKRATVKGYIYAGIPITTMTEIITFTGFSENMFNPDVAELMKPALNTYLTSIAVEDDFKGPFRLTPEPEYQDEIEEAKLEGVLMNLMEEQNPRLAKDMYNMRDEMQQQALTRREQSRMKVREEMREPSKPEGFVTKREESE